MSTSLKAGDRVIHPHAGVGRIEAVRNRDTAWVRWYSTGQRGGCWLRDLRHANRAGERQ